MLDISDAVYSALTEAAIDIHEQIIEAIESDDWAYPRITIRKNKTVAGYRRDIVDLGDLRDSQTWEVNEDINGLGVRFYNTAEHSALVHEGGSNGNAIIPPRPFMTRVLSEINVEELIASKLGANLETTPQGKIRARDPQTGRFTYSRGIADVDVQTDTNNFENYYGGNNGNNS